MGKISIVNGSPRAPHSNSRRYAALFKGCWDGETEEYAVMDKKHAAFCRSLEGTRDLLLVFPLYADGLPAVLMEFLKALRDTELRKKPTVHALINCGFLEPEQNAVAAEIIRLFCRQNGFPAGTFLCVGSGEAILDTPFAFLVRRKIRRMARAIRRGKAEYLQVAMPLTKAMFLRASTSYWLRRGQANGLNREQMATMAIEGSLPPGDSRPA